MKKLSILISVLACFIFVFGLSCSPSKSTTLPYADIFYKVRKNAADKLEKKYDLKLSGFGEGLMGNINLMYLSFQVNHSISKNDARNLIVNAVQDLLADINENEEIRQYLAVYPFDTNHVEIDIFIGTPENGNLYHPYLGVVSACRSNIEYSTDDPDKKHHYKAEETESFEDAVKIIKGELLIPPSQIN